jgi:hypothetical protein
MSKQTHTKSPRRKRSQAGQFRFTAASPTMLFRTIILFATLLVATIAILRGTTDTNAWTFLGSIVIYVALTNGKATSC